MTQLYADTMKQRQQAIPDPRFSDWCKRIAASETTAFEELFKATFRSLLDYVWHFTKDEEQAQDILQETYINLWEARETLDSRRSLKAFLYTIARHEALNDLRKQTRRKILSIAQTDSLVGDIETKAELDNLIRAFIQELPPRRREAFCLSRYYGLTYEEIATVMEISHNTVKVHLKKALEYLRQRMDEFGYGP